MAEMTIKEAAEALNVSADTIRRRIKENKVRAWKAPGAYGLQWVIDSETLADYQDLVETVPVRHNLDPGVLMGNIRNVVAEATREVIREEMLNTMEYQKEELELLKTEIKALREQINEQQEVRKEITFKERIKGIFKT